jgi:hypothetical protein
VSLITVEVCWSALTRHEVTARLRGGMARGELEEKGKTMQKSRRGAAGILLALMLVVPAPVLAGCRQTGRAVEQGVEGASRQAAREAAQQAARDAAKRAGPAGGVYGGCKLADKCP